VLFYSSLFLLCALLVSLPSRAETQQVEGLDFDRVVVMGSSDLEKQPFFMDGDTLVLGSSKKHRKDFGSVRFKLTVVNIEHLQLTGSGDIYVKPLVVEDLYVSVDGSGEIKLFGVRGRDLSLSVSGSGEVQVVELEGEDVKIVVSGSGELFLGIRSRFHWQVQVISVCKRRARRKNWKLIWRALVMSIWKTWRRCR